MTLDTGKRRFLKTAVAGAGAAVAAMSLPVIAAPNITWRMVTAWPKNFPGLGVGAQRLADRITAMSGGRLTIKVYSAGELVPALQAFDAVIEGAAEMCHGTPYYWQNKSQGTNFFTGVPYGMTSGEFAAWMRYHGGQELWDKLYDQFGVKGFLAGDTSAQSGGWFRKPIASLDDLKGINFRTPGLGGQVWQKLGANVVNLAAGDIYTALQSGALDAVEFVGPYNDQALGFHQICKNYYLPSFIEPGMAIELAVNKDKFLALPKDLQAIVEIACQAEYEQVAADYYANDPLALKNLVDKHGVELHEFPEDILEAGAKAAMEIMQGLLEHKDGITREIAQSYVKNLELLRSKTDLFDLPYAQARRKYIKYKL